VRFLKGTAESAFDFQKVLWKKFILHLLYPYTAYSLRVQIEGD
jgi:hypothetical protein